jgi:histidinol-phosphate/aromatic aminotransferase/cobyric acid decarboxylase-like protein
MTVDLHHHGDQDTASGLVDLAVNVRLSGPPPWIAEEIVRTVSDLGSYPDPRAATRAIARRHGVREESVLPTSGGAEAFTLIARAVAADEPWVVHPQFTEPEAALLAAGRPVRRHLLEAGAGFVLDPAAFAAGGVGASGDLLLVGNPTNPTGVLHRRSDVLALRRPGRVVVVDEAFMDTVPGESESLIGGDLEGLLVLRSLTKTWGLAGLRAGYVVGDPALVAALRAAQPPWSVSSPALAATVACLSARGRAEAEAAALEIGGRRAALVEELRAVGLTAVPSAAPFVLVDTHALGPGSPREALAAQGFAVRRGESFPGLGPTWIRLAVRDPQTSREVAAALGRLGGRRVA